MVTYYRVKFSGLKEINGREVRDSDVMNIGAPGRYELWLSLGQEAANMLMYRNFNVTKIEVLGAV